MLTGGDVLQHFPPPGLPFELINNYGPTECTVVATSGIVDTRLDARPQLGRAVANTQIHILDDQLRKVPPGAAGEIYISGAGLARGYHNQPQLTAERFVLHSGTRLYKTGDLGRELADGRITFLGRIDDQIKIRGYRIEPNEIVSALNRHPAVLESAVIAREDRLVAYIVLEPHTVVTSAGLCDFLKTILPGYMLPARFVSLDSLPLTPSGKIDRAALPEPTVENTFDDDSLEAPTSAVEERVSAILKTLLDLDRIGLDDNFFRIGGHSLLGAQVIAQIRDTFGIEFSLRDLFDKATIREISLEIERLILTQLSASGEDEARLILAASGESR